MSWETRTPKINVEQLRSLSVCNTAGSDPQLSWLPDLDAVQAWQQAHGIDLIGHDPLPTGPFVLVENGARPSAGYGVAVSRRAGWDEGVVTLSATFLVPPADAMNAQMLTSPCVLVSLPPVQMRSVNLVDAGGHVRAQVSASAALPPPSPAP